ncbi:MAG TPA: hypothetical protein VF574_04025 [Allosphingosinicella sp.]|jgi:hypothetical protein
MIAPALALLLSLPPAPSPVPAADVGAAAKSFADICLAHSDSAQQARLEAELRGFRKGDTLPGIGGGAPLETYSNSPLDVAIREGKSGRFSCILIFAPEESVDNAGVAAAITALPGLTPRSSKGNAKNWRATWTPLAAPKGSKVYLTIGHGIGHRSAILTLESETR